jgi:hypothetical protein
MTRQVTDNHPKDITYKTQRTIDRIPEAHIVVIPIKGILFANINEQKSIDHSNWKNKSELSNTDLFPEEDLVDKTAEDY